MSALHAEIAALRRRNEALEAEVAILREDVAPVARLRVAGLEISPAEQLVLSLLLRRESVGRDQFSLALWGDAPPRTEKNAVRVLVSQLRRKLDALQVEIRHSRGDGYSISAEHKARLKILPGGRAS